MQRCTHLISRLAKTAPITRLVANGQVIPSRGSFGHDDAPLLAPTASGRIHPMEAQSTSGCADSGPTRSVSQSLSAREVRSVPSADMTKLDDFWLSLSASYHGLVRHDTPTKTCT